jgi:hypothetical protein
MAFDQKQLEKLGIYETKSPLPTLLGDLDQISIIAAAMEGQKKKRVKAGVQILVGGLIGTVFGLFTSLGVLTALSFLAAAGGVAWIIHAKVTAGKLVDHRARLQIAKERIAMIQQDVNLQAPFSFRLALSSNPTQQPEEHWSGRKNGKQQFCEECWLSLEGHLLDGTVLCDEIKDLTRKRTYSNPRGKRKTKVRTTYQVNVSFYYPKSIYGDARPAEQLLHGEVKVAPSARLRDVRVNEKAIALKAQVASENEIVQTAGMLSVGGYRILNLARRMATRQRGNTK